MEVLVCRERHMAVSRWGAATPRAAMADLEASPTGDAAREDLLDFREEAVSRAAVVGQAVTVGLVDPRGEVDPPGTPDPPAEEDNRRAAEEAAARGGQELGEGRRGRLEIRTDQAARRLMEAFRLEYPERRTLSSWRPSSSWRLRSLRWLRPRSTRSLCRRVPVGSPRSGPNSLGTLRPSSRSTRTSSGKPTGRTSERGASSLISSRSAL